MKLHVLEDYFFKDIVHTWHIFMPLHHILLVHLSQRLKCTIVIMRRPSVRRPPIRHPSVVVNFPHFRLLWNRWTEFDETLQKARSQRPLPSLCFSERSQKTRWPPWPLIGWDIFDFSSETAERNSTKLDRKQDLNALYQVCVFRADRKNKMAALASDWRRHFWLLLRNCWTEFNETGQKPSAQRPLPSLCFSGRSKKQYGGHGLWLAETYFDFSSETAEWNSAKLDRKQDLNVLYQVCVYRVEK